jgi:hypothetical protein
MHPFILYIDPGSGSLLFQALLSGFLTFVLFFKNIVAYIKLLFGKKPSTLTDSQQDSHNNDTEHDKA